MADIDLLKRTAARLRMDVLDMVYNAQSGHIGGSLSVADIVTALYFDVMNVKPQDPHWPDRDRFILSKGHAAPVLYAALARRGFFPMEELKRLRQADSFLQGATSPETPGVDITTGPLGMGLCSAVGMACAARVLQKEYKTFVVIGDGELQEGEIWEGMMEAPHFGLDGLVCILDCNLVQMNGRNDEIMPIGNPAEKARAFGWEVREIDGNSMEQVVKLLHEENRTGKPLFVVAHTVKGKGVSFIEGDYRWHGKAPGKEEYDRAIMELQGGLQ